MGKFFDALKKADVQNVNATPSIMVEPAPSENGAAIHEPIEDRTASLRPIPEQPARPDVKPVASSVATDDARQQTPQAPWKMFSPHTFDENLVAYHDPKSFEAEQFRMLRTNILFPNNDRQPPRTILVTSALPGEGKSFVASNLALTIAQNIDKHVLLIDCDLRHPSIHRNFGYDDVPGLSNYLVGEKSLQELLIKTGNSHLSILPGGPTPHNPAELLSSNRMLALLREVRARYDDRFVVIDSPPPHLTAESRALSQFVDGIVLVVKFESTKRELVIQLVDKLQKEKIIGVVANCTDRHTTVSYGSGKYAQYSKYYSSKEIR